MFRKRRDGNDNYGACAIRHDYTLISFNMLRITKLAISGAITLCTWLYLLSTCSDQSTRTLVLLVRAIPRRSRLDHQKLDVYFVMQFPLLIATLFALSLFISLVTGVLNFKTVPKEAELLQEDIRRATKALQSKGIHFE